MNLKLGISHSVLAEESKVKRWPDLNAGADAAVQPLSYCQRMHILSYLATRKAVQFSAH